MIKQLRLHPATINPMGFMHHMSCEMMSCAMGLVPHNHNEYVYVKKNDCIIRLSASTVRIESEVSHKVHHEVLLLAYNGNIKD